MRKMLSIVLVFIFASYVPALAQGQFTDAQKNELHQIIHDYILEHPEIIPEAVDVLRARDREQRLAALGDDLFGGPGAVVQGNPSGDVTLVEFFDYRCPFCRRAWQNVRRLLAEDKNLRIVFRQFPVKDAPGETISYDTALAALAAARQGKYLAFHDAVFSNPTLLDQERTMAIAREVGLDINRLKTDMSDPAFAKGMNDTMNMAAVLQLSGTPSYVIGGNIVSGLMSYDGLKELVAEARGQAAGLASKSGGE